MALSDNLKGARSKTGMSQELVYCLTQGFIGLLIIYAGIGLLGLALMFIVWCVYIFYVNPKFMNRKLTK